MNKNTKKIVQYYASIERLVWYDMSLLFGRAFRFFQDSLHLTLAMGPTISSLISFKILDDIDYEWLDMGLGPIGFGCTFYVGFDYYFTKRLGLGITMSDTVGYMADIAFMHFFAIGFFNKFRLSLGPKFRL